MPPVAQRTRRWPGRGRGEWARREPQPPLCPARRVLACSSPDRVVVDGRHVGEEALVAGPRGARDVPQKPVIPVCSGGARRGREGERGAPPVRDTPCTSMGLGVGWGGSTGPDRAPGTTGAATDSTGSSALTGAYDVHHHSQGLADGTQRQLVAPRAVPAHLPAAAGQAGPHRRSAAGR